MVEAPAGSGGLAVGGADPTGLAIGHDVEVNGLTGAASIAVPVELTEGRGGFTPELTLRYDSTGAPSAFGAGWWLDGPPAITVCTRRGVPTYTSADTFTSSEAGELVPAGARV